MLDKGCFPIYTGGINREDGCAMMKDTKSNVIPFAATKGSAYNAEAEREANVIGSKIDEARRKVGLSMNDFSDLLAHYGVTMSPNGVSKWVRGKALPNAYQLVAICHALDMDMDLSYFCAEYIPLLNEVGERKVRSYRDDLIASGKYKPQPKVTSILRYIERPVSNLSVSAGTGAFLDEGNFEMVSFPENSVPDGAEFGIRVSGDSMEPVYHDGQIVWVQTCESLAVGEVGVFVCDGEGFLKMYDEQVPDESLQEAFLDSTGVLHKQPILVSYNKAYPPRVITPETELKIVGRVL